ncbi:MAG: GNAT family N-acetyltransferase [Lachnospiraceae bacterium]|nr:GNAT family N-acetyltransferase [Lachnospiraceae bacterium]
MTFTYRLATLQDLEAIWNKNIADNPEDNRWVHWKEEYIRYNRNGMAQTYVVVCEEEPVGECTLILSPECNAVRGRLELADGENVANINALRIDAKFEGQGHISKLMACVEAVAEAQNIQALTIGVEAKETRNLGIYLHWGYDTFVMSETEDDELVLYYRKEIR